MQRKAANLVIPSSEHYYDVWNTGPGSPVGIKQKVLSNLEACVDAGRATDISYAAD